MRKPANFDPLRNAKHMAELIGQITSEPLDVVREKLEQERRRPGSTVAEDFSRRGGRPYVWGPEMERFYGSTQAFLYELAVWNRNGAKAKMRRWTTRHLRGRRKPLDILGVGDGLGFDCLHLARKGHRLTYFELPGFSERFARNLFERCAAPVRVLSDLGEIPSAGFDAVTCFDVLEHVPDPPAVVRQLASYLRPGGRLYVSAPFYMIFPRYPTHLLANRQFSGSLELYQQAGLQLVGGRFHWYPVVFAKPEAGRAVSGGAASMLVRATGPVQAVGRWAASPFLPVHWLRRVCNRRFEN
jgi:2-polyprenyl-3-methyl-5-hydroxy-6-metoxy-1,4-benzoquinol methylase